MQEIKPIHGYTDYPVKSFGDKSGQLAPIRKCKVIAYDYNKYAWVMVYEDDQVELVNMKIGYVYPKPGRAGEEQVKITEDDIHDK